MGFDEAYLGMVIDNNNYPGKDCKTAKGYEGVKQSIRLKKPLANWFVEVIHVLGRAKFFQECEESDINSERLIS